MLSDWTEEDERAERRRRYRLKPEEDEIARRVAKRRAEVCAWAEEPPEKRAEIIREAYEVAQHLPPPPGGGGDTANPRWLKLRAGRITGTRHAAVHKMGYESADSMLRGYGEPLCARALQFCRWGTESEPRADAMMAEVQRAGGLGEAWTQARFDHPGLFLDDQRPYMSGSPDGLLVREDGRKAVVEYKCPGHPNYKGMGVATLRERGHIYPMKKHRAFGERPIPPQYWVQCQHNSGLIANCTDIFFCVWVPATSPALEKVASGPFGDVWSGPGGSLHVQHLYFDPHWFARAAETCREFWESRMLRHVVLKDCGFLRGREIEEDVAEDLVRPLGVCAERGWGAMDPCSEEVGQCAECGGGVCAAHEKHGGLCVLCATC